MRKYDFELQDDESLIILEGHVNGYLVRLALDTAATHTVIDFNILLMLGYSNQDSIQTVELETSNGIIEVSKYRIIKFTTLSKTLTNMEILSYDFLSKGILSEYDGILGLDFFANTILTIDFIHQELWLKI